MAWAVRKPVFAKPGLKAEQRIFLRGNLFHSVYCCVVQDFLNLKLKDKQYNQKTGPKNYKPEIQILANPRLTKSGFQQTGSVTYRISLNTMLRVIRSNFVKRS